MDDLPTEWSLIVRCQGVGPQARVALGELIKRYERSVLTLIRRRPGPPDQTPEDLKQDFFARILGRNDISRLDPAKGHFRAWLQVAVTRSIFNEWDRWHAEKYGNGITDPLVSDVTLEQLAELGPGTAPHAYVSRVFYSRTDRSLHIGFAAPIFDGDGHPIGVLLGTTLARSTFGAVQMNCTGNGDCMTALLGSRDRDGPSEQLPDTVNILAEPGLSDGQDRVLDRATSRRICAALDCTPRLRSQFSLPSRAQALILDDYEDPVAHTRSIAALAPVGGTGLVVLVATPDSAAEALKRRMIDRMKGFLWIPIVPGLLLLIALVWGPALVYVRGRRGPPAPSPAAARSR